MNHPSDKPSKPPLVVLADDHGDTREMYADFLCLNGFRVAAAADRRTAVALAKRLRPAAVVLDTEMPKLDGISALKRIRRQPALRDVPVLMLTSYDHHETDALAAGATSVCAKSCAPDTLLEQIRKLLLKAFRHHQQGAPRSVHNGVAFKRVSEVSCHLHHESATHHGGVVSHCRCSFRLRED
jgi:DNA-binding response OmpR family regulator